MLPVERQQQIVKWLESEEFLSVTDISKRLNVSEMTVYRDIKSLMEQKKIMKTSKGITKWKEKQPSTICSYCHKPCLNRHSVQIITKEQRIEQACCPHCGLLRYADIREDVSQILCKDFLNDTTISAKTAYFLMDADLDLHCCYPQVLVFQSLKQIRQFQTGFGGQIYSFDEAILNIQSKMKGFSPCHCD
jgi:DeoR/GlpR family transcriptional regulator of sugar metabolism